MPCDAFIIYKDKSTKFIELLFSESRLIYRVNIKRWRGYKSSPFLMEIYPYSS